MKTVYFRADGHKALGMGHLTRSLTLARELAGAWSVDTRLIVRDDPAARRLLSARDVEPIWLGADLEPTTEIEAMGRLAALHPGTLFVFDLLAPADCEPALEYLRRLNAKTMVVCDALEIPELPVDVFMSGHLGLEQSADEWQMLGPTYFLIDPRLAEIEADHPTGKVERLAVTLGGSDHCDLGERVLRALGDVAPGLIVELAVSRASGTVDALAGLSETLELDVRMDIDPDGLFEFWQRADAALTAGGNTLFERVACRLPGATLCQIPLQQEHARIMEELGVNVNLGMGNDCDDEALRVGLKQFLGDTREHARQYENAPHVVDGRGTDRVRRQLESLGIGPLPLVGCEPERS